MAKELDKEEDKFDSLQKMLLLFENDIEEDYLETVESNINFKKIKPSFKVDVYQNKGESFGSLLENPSKPVQIENENQNQRKTKEEILAEFQKEAGSLRSE